MAFQYKEVIKSASKTVNEVLGVDCDYYHSDGSITPNIFITINEHIEVYDDYGHLAGYRNEASILKEDVENVRVEDEFTDDEGLTWMVAQIIKQSKAKFYVDVVEKI